MVDKYYEYLEYNEILDSKFIKKFNDKFINVDYYCKCTINVHLVLKTYIISS